MYILVLIVCMLSEPRVCISVRPSLILTYPSHAACWDAIDGAAEGWQRMHPEVLVVAGGCGREERGA